MTDITAGYVNEPLLLLWYTIKALGKSSKVSST